MGIVNRCINLLVPFAIRTIIMQRLGAAYLGLGSLFTSIIQVLNLTELGVGSALVFSMYRPIAEGRNEEVCSLLSLYKKLYRLIGFLILCVGVAIMPFLPKLIDMEALVGLDINVYMLFAIYLFNTVATYFFFAYKKSILIASQRQDVISNVDSIVHLIMYLVQIISLYVFPNYYLYIIFLPVFTLIDNGVSAWQAKKMYPYIDCGVPVSLESAKSIFEQMKFLVGHKIGAVIISSADSIVISAFLSMKTLTTYGNYFYVVSAINGFINVGYNAILASVGNSIITENKTKVYTLFEDLTFAVSIVVSFCTICMLCLYQPFMHLWMGENYMFEMTTVVLFCVYFYTWQIRVIGLNFKDAAGMWKNDWFKPYVGMAVNLILNCVLVKICGVDGVLLATIVVMVFVYFPWETVVLFKDLFQRSMVRYILNYFLRGVIVFICSAISFKLTSAIVADNLLTFVFKAVVTCFVAGISLLISYTIFPQMKHWGIRLKGLFSTHGE